MSFSGLANQIESNQKAFLICDDLHSKTEGVPSYSMVSLHIILSSMSQMSSNIKCHFN